MDEQSKKGGEDGGFMIKVATFIVDRRNLFFLLFGIALIFSVVSMNWVSVENALSAYLPATTETSQGLDRMEEQFITYGTAKVMVTNIPYEEADRIYEELLDFDSIIMLDFDNSESHYNNFSALYSITFGYEETDDRALAALDEVRALLDGYDIYVSTSMGDASAEQLAKEMSVISVLVAIVVVSVLLFTSQTWAEVPFLLLTLCRTLSRSCCSWRCLWTMRLSSVIGIRRNTRRLISGKQILLRSARRSLRSFQAL